MHADAAPFMGRVDAGASPAVRITDEETSGRGRAHAGKGERVALGDAGHVREDASHRASSEELFFRGRATIPRPWEGHKYGYPPHDARAAGGRGSVRRNPG